MLNYCVSKSHTYTISRFINYAGLTGTVRIVPFGKFVNITKRLGNKSKVKKLRTLVDAKPFSPLGKLVDKRMLPDGNVLFTDVERMGSVAADVARYLPEYAALRPNVRFFNHPTRSMSRFELLRSLYQENINSFNVYHPLEVADAAIRFPVFIRRKNDHLGPRSALIDNKAELLQALENLYNRFPRDELMVIEFVNSADEKGIFRKYGAFYIDGEVLPRQVQFSDDWMVKRSALFEADYLDEELEYVQKNDHHVDEIKHIFQLAELDYGRIDYGVSDQGIEVWEINSNPNIMGRDMPTGTRLTTFQLFSESLAEAFIKMAGDN